MYSTEAKSRYHIQNKDIWCGAASAMIILADSDVAIPYGRLSQEDLYNKGHQSSANPDDWYIDPKGLKTLLNEYAPAKDFRINRQEDEPEATRDIVAALVEHHIPPATLVDDVADEHWIVVDAVETDVDPSGGKDYTLKGLWIHDPWCGAASANRLHDGSDDCPKVGCPGRWIEYPSGWQGMFASCDCGGNQEEYVVITPKLSVKIKVPKADVATPKFDGLGLAGPGLVREVCLELLEERGLLASKRSKDVLIGALPGEPVLVSRLDRLNDYYYLVPLARAGLVVAWVVIDARWGYLYSMQLEGSESTASSLRLADAHLDVGHKRALAYLEQSLDYGSIALRNNRGILKVYREATTIASALVWRPCRESRSPYLPFYEVSVGGNRVYIRMDGVMFPSLTRGLRGA